MAVTVKMTGPLFSGKAVLMMRQAGQGAIRELVQMGEQRLAATLRPRPTGVYLSVAQAGRGKASTGHYRRNLHATVKDLHGTITDGGVIYGPWLEHGRSGTRFRGYASFRRTGQWLQKQSRRVITAHAQQFVGRMNGSGV